MRIEPIQGELGSGPARIGDPGAAGRFELAMAASFKGNPAHRPLQNADASPDIRDMSPREMADFGFRLFAAGTIDIHTLHRFRRELIATDGTPAADTRMDFAAQARERLAHLDSVHEPKSSAAYRSLRRLLDFEKR